MDAARLDLRVTQDQAGIRLDVLVAEVAGCSRSAAARRLDAVTATVDGVAVKRSHVVSTDEHVLVPTQEHAPTGPVPPVPPIRFRDEHLLVVAKPPGLVVHAGAGHRGDTLVDALRGAGIPLAPRGGDDRPGIVHRLDRDTSGLLAVASTDQAHEGLVEQLRDRTVVRRYLAVVAGTPPTSATVDAPIGRDPTDRQRFACVPEGREAVTHLRVVASAQVDGERASVLVCRLETGRTHQIRVHLRAIGHPVLGDDRYGGLGVVAAALGVDRLALHAGRLAFEHPVTALPVDLTEPVPDDLAEPLARIAPELDVAAELRADA